jgi:hypothetical protein
MIKKISSQKMGCIHMSRVSARAAQIYSYYRDAHKGLAGAGAVLVFCLLLSADLHAAPDFPAPDWLKRTPVAEKMIIHGIPSQVVYFEAERDVEEVLEFYRRTWQGKYAGRSGYREAHVERSQCRWLSCHRRSGPNRRRTISI